MKKIVLLVAAAIFCLIAQTIGQEKYHVIAVGFYNCDNFYNAIHEPGRHDEEFTPSGIYHYSETLYKKKLSNIATVIQKMATDVTADGTGILGLSEIENEQVIKDLLAEPAIQKREYQYVWFDAPDEHGLGIALLYNPKYLKVLKAETIRIPTEKANYSKPVCPVLLVSGLMAGDTVHFLLNEWPSKAGGEKASQARRAVAAGVVKRITDSLKENNRQVKFIIFGDLNENPDEAEVAKILNAKNDKETTRISNIYNPWLEPFKNATGTECFKGVWSLPDQILLSGSFLINMNEKWKYYKNAIYDKDYLKYQTGETKGQPHRTFTANHQWDDGYSAHFPVLIYLISK